MTDARTEMDATAERIIIRTYLLELSLKIEALNEHISVLSERIYELEHVAEQSHKIANLALECTVEDEPRFERLEAGVEALATWLVDVESKAGAQ